MIQSSHLFLCQETSCTVFYSCNGKKKVLLHPFGVESRCPWPLFLVLVMFFPLCFSQFDSEDIEQERTDKKSELGKVKATRNSPASRKRQAQKGRATWGKGQVRLGRILICITALLESIFWISCCISGNPLLKNYAYQRELNNDIISETENVNNFEGISDLEYTIPQYLVKYNYLQKLYFETERLYYIWSIYIRIQWNKPSLDHFHQEDLLLLGDGIPGPWSGVKAID